MNVAENPFLRSETWSWVQGLKRSVTVVYPTLQQSKGSKKKEQTSPTPSQLTQRNLSDCALRRYHPQREHSEIGF